MNTNNLFYKISSNYVRFVKYIDDCVETSFLRLQIYAFFLAVAV